MDEEFLNMLNDYMECNQNGKHEMFEELVERYAVAQKQLAAYRRIAEVAQFIRLNRRNFEERDPDGVKKATLDRLEAALDAVKDGDG